MAGVREEGRPNRSGAGVKSSLPGEGASLGGLSGSLLNRVSAHVNVIRADVVLLARFVSY